MANTAMERTRHPGIYRRGGRYVVTWRHRGRQHKSSHRTLAEALEAKGQRQAGESAPITRVSFEDYARDWLAGYQGRTSRGFTAGARHDYRQMLERHAQPFFRGRRLGDVTPRDVRAFVSHLEAAGLSPGSILKQLVPVKALFATAVEDGELRSNPALGVRVNRRRGESEEEPAAKAMTRAELARVLGEVPPEWLLFFELLAHTGLRISEALGLDWGDVAFGQRPRLRVRRQFNRGELKRLKTRAARRDLPLSPGLARRLWAARPPSADGAMFATRTGTRFDVSNLRRVLDRATERAGTPRVGFHAFRHTCASMLLDGGKNIRQVSEWLGHADPAFTLRTYVHLMDEGLGEAAFLDAAVQSGNRMATGGPGKAANATEPMSAENAG